MLRIMYAILCAFAAPLLWLNAKLVAFKHPRLGKERLGKATKMRPTGPLIWCHGASVGEIASLMPLMKAVQAKHPQVNFLVTSSSKSSGAIIPKRLPSGMIYQYLPFDTMPCVRRFLNHWRPDLVLWVESDYWPNLIIQAAKKAPIILLNGRISEKSFSRWRWFPPLIKIVVKKFKVIFPQSEADHARLKTLGNPNTFYKGNIKYFVSPMQYDVNELKNLQASLKNRPFWLAASTHEGEESIVFQCHKDLKRTLPNLLTIVVPRHPVRTDKIIGEMKQMGLSYAQRSKGGKITAETDIYLGDTFGDLGLFYALAPFVFLGGSLKPIGGHTPIEPAILECGVITGPHTFNNQSIFKDFEDHNALVRVQNGAELLQVVGDLLKGATTMAPQIESAIRLINAHQKNKKQLLTTLHQEVEGILKNDTP